MGLDVTGLLDRACEMADACRLDEGNPGLDLGLALGAAAGRRAPTRCACPTLVCSASGSSSSSPSRPGSRARGWCPRRASPRRRLDRQEHEVRLADPLELGQEFFRWEFATAVAGSILGINPFDQPDVQAAKDKTNEVLAAGDVTLEPEGSIDELVEGVEPPDYICIQAFVDPTAGNEARIAQLAGSLQERSGCVVTRGFGPRYLHSTGQLHKGGPANGVFLQIVEDYGAELQIPGKPFGFAQLIRAQAAGDFESLRERGRRIARVKMEEVT